MGTFSDHDGRREQVQRDVAVTSGAPIRMRQDNATAKTLLTSSLLKELERRVLDYENAINWNVPCAGCAKRLDGAIEETWRREQAEARLAAIAAHCRQRMDSPGRAGMSHAAARLILGIAEGRSDEGKRREPE